MRSKNHCEKIIVLFTKFVSVIVSKKLSTNHEFWWKFRILPPGQNAGGNRRSVLHSTESDAQPAPGDLFVGDEVYARRAGSFWSILLTAFVSKSTNFDRFYWPPSCRNPLPPLNFQKAKKPENAPGHLGRTKRCVVSTPRNTRSRSTAEELAEIISDVRHSDSFHFS